jgi:hypothetical protein
MLIFLFFAIKDDETAAEKFIEAALANLHTATSPNKVSLDRKKSGCGIQILIDSVDPDPG